MQANENWKPVAGYEGLYEVSDLGNVRSLWFGKQKILKPGPNNRGYLVIGLRKDVKYKRMLVHRLVAEAFIPNPNNLGTVNHLDENKLNNAASNLEWMSMKDNINYGSRNKRAAETRAGNPKWSKWSKRPKLPKSVQQLDKQGNLLATFPSISEASRATGINCGNICSCCCGNLKSAGGFVWKYA